MKASYWSGYLTLVVLLGCKQLSEYSTDTKAYTSRREDEVILCAPGSPADTTGTAQGKNGHLNGTSLQSELNIIVDGFKIIPLLGSGSWASFIPHRDSAWVSGDIIINENDLAVVHTELAAQGFTIKDAHRYGSRNGSILLFLHIDGFGDSTILAKKVNTLYARLESLVSRNPEKRKVIRVGSGLNIARLDSILSCKGEAAGGLYKHTISRPDVLRNYGIPLGSHVEFNTWAAWQGTDEKAVVAGDFMILQEEVAPVAKALAENGFEIIYNHLVHEEPGIFSLHYLGFGNAEKLANGLKTALDQQATK
jgi:hypothetical protein